MSVTKMAEIDLNTKPTDKGSKIEIAQDKFGPEDFCDGKMQPPIINNLNRPGSSFRRVTFSREKKSDNS